MDTASKFEQRVKYETYRLFIQTDVLDIHLLLIKIEYM